MEICAWSCYCQGAVNVAGYSPVSSAGSEDRESGAANTCYLSGGYCKHVKLLVHSANRATPNTGKKLAEWRTNA